MRAILSTCNDVRCPVKKSSLGLGRVQWHEDDIFLSGGAQSLAAVGARSDHAVRGTYYIDKASVSKNSPTSIPIKTSIAQLHSKTDTTAEVCTPG